MKRLIFVGLALLGCEKKLSMETVEDMRRIARDNGELNAQNWRMRHESYRNWRLETQGDSTISRKCPQGDGWTSMALVNPKTGKRQKLKCSTISTSIGCLKAEQFAGKTYAKEDGRCNPEIDFPLPKLNR